MGDRSVENSARRGLRTIIASWRRLDKLPPQGLRSLLKYWQGPCGADIPVCQILPVSATQCPPFAATADRNVCPTTFSAGSRIPYSSSIPAEFTRGTDRVVSECPLGTSLTYASVILRQNRIENGKPPELAFAGSAG